MLDAKADKLCNAEKYQRSEARSDTRAGHYQRKLHTRAGEVTLQVPKVKVIFTEQVLAHKTGIGI